MPEFEVKERVEIPDGKHTGKITHIAYRHEPYEYTDVFVKLDKTDTEIKYGAPSNVSLDTKLGRLLDAFGEIKPGDKVDPEKILVGKECELMTLTEDVKGKDGILKGSFARIVEGSLKPKK